MYGLHFREQLPTSTEGEFDALVSRLKSLLLKEHNDDGSHKLFTNSLIANPNSTLGKNILEEEGHWWRKGPWRLDDPRATDKHIVGLRPSDPAAGTYNDYAPDGIDTAVLVEIEPLGDITLTGLKAPLGRNKRFLILRNRDSSATITLSHNSSLSALPNRFSLPSGEDLELGPRQAVWLYYDPTATAYTLSVTSHVAGGIASGGNMREASRSLTYIELRNLGSTPLEIIPAPGAEDILFPIEMTAEQQMGATFFTLAPSVTLVFRGQAYASRQIDAVAHSNALNRYMLTTHARLGGTLSTGVDFDPRGLAMDLIANADTTNGSGNYKYTVRYVVITSLYP